MLSRFGWFMAALLLGVVILFAAFVRISPQRQPKVQTVEAASAPTGGSGTGAAASQSFDARNARQALPGASSASDAPAPPLVVPVAGVAVDQLEDSYGDPRGKNRTHEGIDIVAAKGTPVLAAGDGKIRKLYFSHGGGGITLYERSADGRWMFYYAHLAGYAPGIREGMRVKAGQQIAFVGDSGNAPPDVYHLHFGVSRMAKGDGWWQGKPVNPYPLLAGSRRER